MNTSAPAPSNPSGDGEDTSGRPEEWARRARNGDPNAFEELVKMYSARVHAVVYRIVRNEDDTRDVCQQAWVKAWRKLESYGHESKFFTWLYRIAVNTALDFMRSRSRMKEVSVEDQANAIEGREVEWPAANEDGPDAQLTRDEVRATFMQALESLSAEHRAALMLREVEGHSYREIAAITGSRMGTVMSRIFYARKLIQERMKHVR